jgi:hypothetical protein
MKREEVHEVFRAFYDPDHKAYPGDYRNLVVAPFESVQAVVSILRYAWTEDQIRLAAAIIGHASSTQTIELMNDILSSENMIRDITQSIRPATTSAIVMHAVTFCLGVALILSAIISAMQNQILFSGLLGGLGITSFLYIFFRQPIQGVQRGISQLIQLEVIYNGYAKQLGYWKAYERSNDVSLKPDILAEIDYCTRHTLYLIEKCSGHRPVSRPKELVHEPRQSGPTPQASGPPKMFAEKVMVMEKNPSEKVAYADNSLPFEAEASVARIPPKFFMDSKLPAVDEAAFQSGQPVEEGKVVATPDLQDADNGATPFVLATPHHASNWQTVELSTVEELLVENKRKAAEIGQVIEELKELPAYRQSGTREYRHLEALYEQQRTVESERKMLAARKDALTGAG